MCLFTKGRNALIAVLDLALHENNGPVSLPAICDRTGLSLSYLECIFRKLRYHGIVLTIRGAHGGFLLARSTNELTVADIILAVGESREAREDGVGGGNQQAESCRATAVSAEEIWISLSKQLVDYCATVSLKELIERHRAGKRSTLVECPRSPIN